VSLELEAEVRLGSFDYHATFAVQDEIVVLFGHSGAGKSLTLQLVAGLLRPDRGRIRIDGETVFDSAAGVDVPAYRRLVGYVVQNLALFPHLSVEQNVAFGIPAGTDRRKRVTELLELLGLGGLGGRLPRTLSGGQQQRVALARALARDTRLLLLDEPFSALDDSLREGLRRELVRLRRELGLSTVFVTHDLREAHLLADRLAVFDEGRMLQIASRDEVFRHPASRRVAELTGVANILPGTAGETAGGVVAVDVGGHNLQCPVPPGRRPPAPGEPVDLAVRAERVILRRGSRSEHTGPNIIDAEIVEELSYGATHTLILQPGGGGPQLSVEIAARPYEVLGIATQKRWAVELPPADLHLMPR
jgi:molybdate transport system ATP-binding protein